jgi:hypothetical protein
VFLGGGSCLFCSAEEVVEYDVCGAVLFSWAGVEGGYFHGIVFRGTGIWFFHDGYCGLLVDYGVWGHGVYMVYLVY